MWRRDEFSTAAGVVTIFTKEPDDPSGLRHAHRSRRFHWWFAGKMFTFSVKWLYEIWWQMITNIVGSAGCHWWTSAFVREPLVCWHASIRFNSRSHDSGHDALQHLSDNPPKFFFPNRGQCADQFTVTLTNDGFYFVWFHPFFYISFVIRPLILFLFYGWENVKTITIIKTNHISSTIRQKLMTLYMVSILNDFKSEPSQLIPE